MPGIDSHQAPISEINPGSPQTIRQEMLSEIITNALLGWIENGGSAVKRAANDTACPLVFRNLTRQHAHSPVRGLYASCSP
ncbi:uncharacterized protein M421DRAFT_139754 [Didymella exigua CBS 183.55]|uniref:Uncharacterized protein n=1 Tax=Didymella exigua CBS 183.55 TaxID=1150837 RepID=A0A6A5RW49_9PLEO|nr:uncharacterized protein M421DRAFT_139754 [Didymella exigua CBS 183.55]KAF1929497.1 hypothetical protein M421DRAFT_139754 [Didymella exigua CBS 183.55]